MKQPAGICSSAGILMPCFADNVMVTVFFVD